MALDEAPPVVAGDPLAEGPPKDHLPDPEPPPPTFAERLKAFAKRRSGVIAILAALYATWKVGRWLIVAVWNLRGVDEVGPWLADHWVWVALGLAAVFAGAFVLVRAVIPRLTR